jgi:hypothetical protein
VACVFWPLRVAGYFRQKPFWQAFLSRESFGRLFFRQKPFWQAFLSPETVSTGFRHLPAGRRYALHP